MRKINQKLRFVLSAGMILPLMILTAACDQTSAPVSPDDIQLSEQIHVTSPFNLENSGIDGSTAAQLARVRAATARFHRAEVAEAAGYVETPCVAHHELGGMGHHFVKGSLIGPPENLDITQPQALLYEPQKNGRLRLVGVEYITAPDQNDIDPPMLFGEHFHWNEGLKFWALHVWVWRNNPSGIFFDWNPNVSC